MIICDWLEFATYRHSQQQQQLLPNLRKKEHHQHHRYDHVLFSVGKRDRNAAQQYRLIIILLCCISITRPNRKKHVQQVVVDFFVAIDHTNTCIHTHTETHRNQHTHTNRVPSSAYVMCQLKSSLRCLSTLASSPYSLHNSVLAT